MNTYISYAADAFLTQDGDILFSNGDIKLVSGIPLLKNVIYNLLVTEKGDWKLFTDVGASLSKFNGYSNTRETANEIKQYIITGVASFILPYTVDVRIVPIDYETVKCYIFIDGADLPTREVMLFELNYQNTFTYKDFDPTEDTLISSELIKTNTEGSLLHPNKFVDRLRNQ